MGRPRGSNGRDAAAWDDGRTAQETIKGLTAARRQETALLRRLGQQALEVLAQGGSLDLGDAQARGMVEELVRTHRKMAVLEDRLLSLRSSPHRRGALPPTPGTDRSFPFSR